MDKIITSLRLPEGEFNVEIIEFKEADRKTLYFIYKKWRELSDCLIETHGRGINLPEVLSESAFCLEMRCVRKTSTPIIGANSSWDCYNLETKNRIQLKACSVIPDLTSFGSKSQWDEIFFLDFYRNGAWDGTFDIYEIESEKIYNHYVNKMETFRDQQKTGKRPRLSLSNLITQNDIKAIKTGDLSKKKKKLFFFKTILKNMRLTKNGSRKF